MVSMRYSDPQHYPVKTGKEQGRLMQPPFNLEIS